MFLPGAFKRCSVDLEVFFGGILKRFGGGFRCMFDCVFAPSYALVKDATKHAAITLHPGALQQCVVDFDDLGPLGRHLESDEAISDAFLAACLALLKHCPIMQPNMQLLCCILRFSGSV
jgi:hypothetical protein